MVQAITTKPPKTGGDDLDDGLELDPDLLASSDVDEEEGQASSSGSAAREGGEVDILESEDVNETEEGLYDDREGDDDAKPAVSVSEGRKRKTIDGDGDFGDSDAEAEKKRRKKEKEKERKARKVLQKAAEAISNPPTHFSIADLSALLLKSMRESFRSASTLELDELSIPDDNLLPPADYPPPKAQSEQPFERLTLRLESVMKPLQRQKLKTATPRVIILCLSGLRCADVVREVRGVKGDGEVAKLFAKHFKMADQAKYLAKTKVSIAVGTPARVGKLLAEDAIKITKDTVLLLDISHQDDKTRTLLNLPEVRDELWKSVFSGVARERLFSGGVRIGVF